MRKTKFYFCEMALCMAISVIMPAVVSGAEEKYSKTASSEEQVSNTQTVGKYGMLPIYGRDVKDGTYEIEVESSSSMFRIIEAQLMVEDQEMEAVITLSGTGYLKLFMGTGEEAAGADDGEYIGFEEDADGMYTYTIPVEALDKELHCAAYSKRKEQWYDRVILFDASSLPDDTLKVELPDYEKIEKALEAYKEAGEASSVRTEESEETAENTENAGETETKAEQSVEAGALSPFEPVSVAKEDGVYAIEVTLTGGSGKASVNSPTYLTVKEGKGYARIQWSSSNYDYMIVGGEKYLNESEEGGYSTFTIPISVMDEEMPVIADTTAMGEPHEVAYALTFYEESIGSKSQMPQEGAKRVVAIAMVIIVGGGILNHFINKKKRV
ncbi:MAG: hypothetical protein Q4C77_05470 [Eubacteriales bacterium]|nr:hypothetical protein [Eubacteriales bacterium]